MTDLAHPQEPTIITSPTFELPEEPPSIPEFMIRRIEAYLPAKEADLLVEDPNNPGSFSRRLKLLFNGSGHDPTDIATIVKCWADEHVQTYARKTRFRLLLHRDEGRPTLVRRQVSFVVRSPYDDDVDNDGTEAGQQDAELKRVIADGHRDLHESWVAQAETQRAFAELVLQGSMQTHDLMREMMRQAAASRLPVADTLSQAEQVYRAGLAARAEAVDTVGHLQMEMAKLSGGLTPPPGPLDKLVSLFAPAVGPAAQAVIAALTSRGEPEPPTRQLRSANSGEAPRVAAPTPAAQVVTIPEPEPEHRPTPTTVDSVAVERRPDATPPPPSLRDVLSGLLASIETSALLQLLRALDDRQREALYGLEQSDSDEDAARRVVKLVDALTANPAALLSLRDVLSPEQLSAFEQLAKVCQARCAQAQPQEDELAQEPVVEPSTDVEPDTSDEPDAD